MEKRFANENFPPEIQAKADQMNLDRNNIHPYTVPEPESKNGSDLLLKERQKLLKDFEKYLYGVIPPPPSSLSFELAEEDCNAMNGKATRRQITIRCGEKGKVRFLHLLLYIPNKRTGKVPVWFGLNFKGNHACTFDENVLFTITKTYPTLHNSIRFADGRAGIEQRGLQDGRWCFEKVIDRGYAAATICYFDCFPDHPYGFKDSIMSLYYDEQLWNSKQRPSTEISAWAWGILRAVDCLETQPEIDSTKIAVHGHSRLGKTALWAGANDPRIALTVSCCSGTCGAKLTRRYCGEDLAWIHLWHPCWIMEETVPYLGRDWDIPVEQSQLFGCIAPRLSYVTSGTEDDYADPEGEFLSAKAGSAYYRLFGSKGIGTDTMPEPGIALTGDIGYYLRKGPHNITPDNWDHLLDYADLHWKG